jgi:hypothetical protein
MRYLKPYLAYMIPFLAILMMTGCMATKTISIEEYKNRGEIRLVAMNDGSLYQVHSGGQVSTCLKNDSLIFKQFEGNILTSIPVSGVDHCNVYRISAKKSGSTVLGVIFDILFFWL